MKNILVVSDSFDNGGLETQIYTYYKELKNKAKFTFIFGNYNRNNKWDFGDSKIYDNLKFNENTSINNFKKIVLKYVDIINTNNIDVIHVHPFFCTIPALFASQITKVPICFTYHGFASISFPNTVNVQVIFNYAFNEIFSKIFCVYKNITEDLNKKLRFSNAFFTPNPIDINAYQKVKFQNNGKWTMPIRISDDKIDSIEYVISSLDSLSIKELHLFGSGNKVDYIKNVVNEKHLEDRVFLHGYTNEINVKLNNFNGLIGMGRAAAEGISMQLPVMLVGYGKNCGIIDKSNYEILRNNNYAPIFLKPMNNEDVKKQVEKLNKKTYKSDIYKMFCENSSSTELAKKYFIMIDTCEPNIRSNFLYLYNSICEIDSNDSFSNSDDVYKLVETYLKSQSTNLDLNAIMVFYDTLNTKLANMDNQFNKKLDNLKDFTESTMADVDNKLASEIINIYDHINVKYLIFKTKDKIKKRFRKTKK